MVQKASLFAGDEVKAFGIMAETTLPKKTCFIAMPISTPEHLVKDYGDDPDHFEHVLEELFIPAIEEAGMQPIRPTASGSENIHAETIDFLQSADLVLVDLSSLNPNVFFEFGVRTSLNLPACPVRDEKTVKLPFDTGTLNTPFYNSDLRKWIAKTEIPKLAQHLKTSWEKSGSKNALWKHFGFRQTAEKAAAPSGTEEKLDALLNEFSLLRANLTATVVSIGDGNVHDAAITNVVTETLAIQVPGQPYTLNIKEGVLVVRFLNAIGQEMDKMKTARAVSMLQTILSRQVRFEWPSA